MSQGRKLKKGTAFFLAAILLFAIAAFPVLYGYNTLTAFEFPKCNEGAAERGSAGYELQLPMFFLEKNVCDLAFELPPSEKTRQMPQGRLIAKLCDTSEMAVVLRKTICWLEMRCFLSPAFQVEFMHDSDGMK